MQPAPERIIRPDQDTDESEVIGVWHRSGLAAYPYLPTWQAMTLETAAYVFRTIIRPSTAIWVGVLDGRVVAYLAMQGSYIDRLYVDPPEWHKWLVIRKTGKEVAVSDRPIAFWGDFEPNYRPRHDENMAAMEGAPSRAVA